MFKWRGFTFKETIDSYELFGENIIDFKYILIDVNRYSEEELLQLSNLIGSIFLLDRKTDREKLLERLRKLTNVLKNLSEDEFVLLRNWVTSIISRSLPEEKKKEVKEILESSKEAEKMISNLERSLKHEFKKSKIEGKIEGKREGKIEGILAVLIEQLREKFTNVPSEFVDELKKLDDKTLLLIAKDIFKIEKIDDLKKYIN
ncbi:MAG: hypothetical protein QME35_01355 [Thermoanaerobacteraceae bacterium]|nr:hypothetical protein [Thermoanaerobacteraceae bacterium]